MRRKKQKSLAKLKRRLVAREGRQKIACAWCEACDENRDMLTVECATLVSGLTHREIFKHVESGCHFTELAGRPLICFASICELMPQMKEAIKL
jgi:hypothetical protein